MGGGGTIYQDRRKDGYYVQLKSDGVSDGTPGLFDIAVFTPKSNSGSAGGGVACPGTGSTQNNVFGNAWYNSGSAADNSAVCAEHGDAAWYPDTDGVQDVQDTWSFNDAKMNRGYTGGAGDNADNFAWSGTPWNTSGGQSWIMVRVTKRSGTSCRKYKLKADAFATPECTKVTFGSGTTGGFQNEQTIGADYVCPRIVDNGNANDTGSGNSGFGTASGVAPFMSLAYGDKFEIQQNGDRVKIRRIDVLNGGWGAQIEVMCCKWQATFYPSQSE
jgi:hypothetical protein